jgi:predicted dehydrogenase
MSDHLVWIIGAGNMAVEYSKVLHALNVEHFAVGNSSTNIENFKNQTGHPAYSGGLDHFLEKSRILPSHAIVTVNVENLYQITTQLINFGVKNILVEKPGSLHKWEFEKLLKLIQCRNSIVYVGYNRRFYASVIKTRELILDDGGLSSFNFEFTEWSHEIEKLSRPKEVFENWFLANSTHVVDLAFFVGGKPREWATFTAGSLIWHQRASRFAGAGVTENQIPFTYNANWESAGRWGVEFLTTRRKLILKPLEKLFEQQRGSLNVVEVQIDDNQDLEYKPGLFKQTRSFLNGDGHNLCSFSGQLLNYKFYQRMISPNECF